MCFDKGSGYYDSRDYDTTVASLELGEFCVIPVSPWRQSIYGHLKEFEEDLDQYLEAVGRQRSEGPPRVPEEARLGSLKDLAHGMYRNDYSFSDADIQENIWSYCHRYGPLPEDFAALIEADGADRNLSTC